MVAQGGSVKTIRCWLFVRLETWCLWLNERHHWREVLAGAIVVALLLLNFIPLLLADPFPHPTVGFRMMRILVLAIAIYAIVTKLISVASFYVLGRRWCKARVAQYPFLTGLEHCHDYTWRVMLKNLVKGLGWKECLQLLAIFTVLGIGIGLQRLALEMILSIH
jgi:hypothetical protein